MIVDKILQHYSKEEKDRVWSNNVIRASSSGKCQRALAYQHHGVKGKALDARARMLFRLGDLVEKDLVEAAVQYGLVGMQQEANVECRGFTITGSIDGYMMHNDEMVIVDFKSCSDFAFRDAQKNNVAHGYVCQMHCYMAALGAKKALLVYYKKHTSHLHEVMINYDDKIMNEIVKRFENVLASTPDNLPEKEFVTYKKDGSLGFPCSYCAYLNSCFPNIELSFDKQSRPILKEK